MTWLPEMIVATSFAKGAGNPATAGRGHDEILLGVQNEHRRAASKHQTLQAVFGDLASGVQSKKQSGGGIPREGREAAASREGRESGPDLHRSRRKRSNPGGEGVDLFSRLFANPDAEVFLRALLGARPGWTPYRPTRRGAAGG